jgi:hypothetical protein
MAGPAALGKYFRLATHVPSLHTKIFPCRDWQGTVQQRGQCCSHKLHGSDVAQAFWFAGVQRDAHGRIRYRLPVGDGVLVFDIRG